MIRAETFVKRLTQEKIISQEFADGLLERLAQSAQVVPADLFAQRLVERGVITQAISVKILDILEKAEKIKEAKKPKPKPKLEKKKAKPLPTPPPFVESEEDEPNLFVDDLQSDPFGPLTASPSMNGGSDGPEIPSVFRSKRSNFKTVSANPWDSKLLLYGICGVILLLVVGIILFNAIYRRGAEEYFNAANAARDSGNYNEAIKEYEDYIQFFPNHSQINEATIRLSLSKMRLITDSKSDWPQALKVAKEEIAKIVLQPDYRPEAEPEFTAILPTIAENLATSAKDKKDAKLLAEAEEAMQLVQKHVPVSAQPVDRLQKIQVNIDFTKREIAKDERLAAVAGEVQSLQQAATQSNDVRSAYEKTVALQNEYPGIEKDERFLEILQKITHNEKNAVRFENGEQFSARFANTPDAEKTAAENLTTNNYVILADRKAVNEKATRTEQTLFAYAAGSVFALRSTDGKILWKKTIGGSQWTADESPTVFPMFLAGSGSSNAGALEEAFLIDYRNWEILRLDSRTGDVHFRCRIGEPFRIMDIPMNRKLASFFLTTYSGKCIQVDAKAGRILGVVELPQTTNVAPLLNFENNYIIQIAHRTSLYICPLQKKSVENLDETVFFDETAPAESLYLGHLPGTIRATPFFFGSYLLIPRQSNANDSELCVYEVKKSNNNESSNENSSGNQESESSENTNKTNGYSLSLLQTIPLKGKIDTTPLKDGKNLFLATDTGRIALYVLDENASTKQPIRFVAESVQNIASNSNSSKDFSADSPQRMWNSSRYLGLFDGNLWVAGNELISYEVQRSRSQLVSIRQSDPLTRTLAPLRRIDDTVFRTFRYNGQNAVAIKAFSLPEGKPLWETQFAAPCVQEPTWNAQTQTLRCVTQTGKLYQIPVANTNSGPVVLDKPFANLVGEKRGEPIRFLVPLANSMEAWIESSGVVKAIPVFDPSPNNPQKFRFIPMNERTQADPTAFGTGLLVPLRSGKVALFDPQSGAMLADPFFVKLSPNNVSQWSAPLSVTGANRPTFLILDQQQDTLYRVVAERNTNSGSSGRIKLRIVAEVVLSDLDREKNANRIAQIGETAFVFSLKKGTAQEVQLESDSLGMQLGRIRDFGDPIVWGPFRQGDSLFFATSQQRLHVLSSKSGAITEEKKEIPPNFSLVGRPFVAENRTYFNSSTGTLWTFGGEAAAAIQTTGVPTHCGPILFENRLCSPGNDGTLYFYQE